MRYASPLGFLLLFTLSSACAAPPEQDESAVGSSALASSASAASGKTITFTSSFTQSPSAPLVAGDVVTIAYDAARLPSCRGDISTGHPGWSISAVWSVNGGPVGSVAVAGQGLSNGPNPPTFTVPAAGDLAMWFQVTSVWGCTAWDSAYGANYHFAVAAPANAPGWVGDATYLFDRAECNGPCFADQHALDAGGAKLDTWARQRAAFSMLFFEAWKAGVTDFDNPNLWKQLDAEMHWRVGGNGPFQMSYVSFHDRDGNNARYDVDLRAMDLLPGQNGGALTDKTNCPTFPVTVSTDGQYVDADMQLYFTVNGVELRPAGGGVFHVTFENYAGLYSICGIGGTTTSP